MYCQYCGKELNEGEVCNCPGAAAQQAQPQQEQQYQQANAQQQSEQQQQPEGQQYQQGGGQYTQPNGAMNGLAVGGFVVAILALIFAFIPFFWLFTFIFSVLAVILSGAAMSQIGKNGGAGKGFAVAGLVIGIIILAINLLSIIALVSCIGMATSCFAF